MESKVRIADAGNVGVPAYLALKQKGFDVSCVPSTTDPEQEQWFAEDRTRWFMANDIVSLLGLVALYETRGENWQASDEAIDDFLRKFEI